ncbi:TnsA-like heteromeric transposase endonuclease subunit [Streptomyces sp. C10-9-1]|uniref:TnsA-like heteromeric transposase endonuclease subunit n=1 Tax=Streptomyces sp. C10-9-1 TaxID=1859285 RepID=UPI003D738CBF
MRGRLRLGDGWTRRWSGTWLVGGGKVAWPLRDLPSVPLMATRPVRAFTWRSKQEHRPGLEFMVSTGRLHGFESLEERRLLLALDFVRVRDVLSQPFELGFETIHGRERHTPDYLAVMPDSGIWLFDVRPAALIRDADVVKFAAAREAAVVCGWRYSVVVGLRPHVHSVLDGLSSQRRPMKDPLSLQPELMELAGQGEMQFGALVKATRCEAVARANAKHLLWHRQLATDLGRPLVDSSMVWPASVRGES